MGAQCRSAALNSGIDDIPLSASWSFTALEEPLFPHLEKGKIYYFMGLLECLVNQCREDSRRETTTGGDLRLFLSFLYIMSCTPGYKNGESGA